VSPLKVFPGKKVVWSALTNVMVPLAAPLTEIVQLPDTVTDVAVTAVTSALTFSVLCATPPTFTDFNVTVSPTR
jgi:hypothetical protein